MVDTIVLKNIEVIRSTNAEWRGNVLKLHFGECEVKHVQNLQSRVSLYKVNIKPVECILD